MEDIFKRVLDRISGLSREELRAKLESVADHPLVKVFEILDESLEFEFLWSSEEIFFKKYSIDELIDQQLTFEDLSRVEEWLAANDELFLLAA